MNAASMNLVEITKNYYDSPDADNFYFHVWGGNHIHIGIYDDQSDSIQNASHRTVETMASRFPWLGKGHRVLDLGAGYGGAARYLASTRGCRVTALNLSATENARNLAMSADAGLCDLVEIVEGSYEEVPAEAETYDVVWSQDAILHSGRKELIFREAARVLKPGGDFIFTDPMESGHGSREELKPVLDRIHLTAMGSFAGYEALAKRAGLETLALIDLTPQLPIHYARVRDELRAKREDLSRHVSPAFVDRMLSGLDHWVSAGERGNLAWGILHFRKCAESTSASS